MLSVIVTELVQKKSDAPFPGRETTMREKPNLIKAGVIVGTCSIVLLLHACGAVPLNDQASKQAGKSQEPRTFVFSCSDGFKFVARTEGDTVWLFLPSGTLELQKSSADSYRTKGTTLLIVKEQSLLEEPGGKHTDCRNNRRLAIWEHAKLNGADFRAIGNEPGWHLEIRNQAKIVLVSDYGSSQQEFDLPEAQINTAARTTRYNAHQAGQEIILTISGESCHDSMSGEEFESKVEVVFNGIILRGCGRALH